MKNKKKISITLTALIILVILIVAAVVVVLFLLSNVNIKDKNMKNNLIKTENILTSDNPNNEEEEDDDDDEQEESDEINGNLLNYGFVAQADENIIITNSLIDSEEIGIYKITKNDRVSAIEEADYICGINYKDDFIYFLKLYINDNQNIAHEIIKMKIDGSKRKVLVDDIETISIGEPIMEISGDKIYFLNNKVLESIGLDGKNREEIKKDVSRFQIVDDVIYYSDGDGKFNSMMIDGSDVKRIGDKIDHFQIVGSYIYYINKTNHHVCRLNIKKNFEEEEVIKEYVRVINIANDTIYYVEQDSKNNAHIKKVDLDGENEDTLIDLNSINTYINVAGDWIYFTDSKRDSVYYYSIYRVKTTGGEREEIEF